MEANNLFRAMGFQSVPSAGAHIRAELTKRQDSVAYEIEFLQKLSHDMYSLLRTPLQT